MSNLKGLLETLDNIDARDFEGSEVDRLQLVETAKRLLSRVQSPQERLFDIAFGQPAVAAALQVFLDLGLWKQWAAVGGVSKSVDELCKLCTPRCDTSLLQRLLGLLAANHLVRETDKSCYELTPSSLADVFRWVQARTHHWDPACLNFPAFLAKTGYKEPLDPKNSNYVDWSPGNLDFFKRCIAEPALQESFSNWMKGWGEYKLPWPEFYDTGSLVGGADLTNGGVLCVDLGGHHGIDLTRLLNRHPDLPSGSLVLQDLPEVLAEAKNVDEKIVVMPHDLFQPQPVKGSRSYFFHAVFHDWLDDTAADILRHTAAVMRKGYSRVLIVDIVLPNSGASAIQSAMDVQMMVNLSAMERSETAWTALLQSVGLTIIKFWKDGRGNECLIEAELA